jgi:hypothetical protein
MIPHKNKKCKLTFPENKPPRVAEPKPAWPESFQILSLRPLRAQSAFGGYASRRI